MYATIDTNDVDLSPKLDNRLEVSILFIAFMSITSFFVMNLFDSVIVDKFNEEIKKREGAHNFSAE